MVLGFRVDLSFPLLIRRLLSAFLYPGFESHPESCLSFESGPTVGESSSQFLILIFGPGLSESRKGKGHPDRDVVFLTRGAWPLFGLRSLWRRGRRMKIMVVAFQVWFMGLDLWVIRKRFGMRVRRGFLVWKDGFGEGKGCGVRI